MHQDRTKWNNRYLASTKGAPTPPGFLKNNGHLLRVGCVLDVAAGDGAAALYLAHQPSFNVTAIDISEEGLKRLAVFAAAQGVEVTTQCIDLDDAQQVSTLGVYDTIVISYFKPSAALLQLLISRLCPGGSLLLTTYNLQHHQATGFPARFCLAPGELTQLSDKLQLIRYESETADTGHFDGYLFRKLSD